MTTLESLVDKLSQAVALFGAPADVHGVIPLAVTDANGETAFRALIVTERAVRLSGLSGRFVDFAEIDVRNGAIKVPARDHPLIKLLESLAWRVPDFSTRLGIRMGRLHDTRARRQLAPLAARAAERDAQVATPFPLKRA